MQVMKSSCLLTKYCVDGTEPEAQADSVEAKNRSNAVQPTAFRIIVSSA